MATNDRANVLMLAEQLRKVLEAEIDAAPLYGGVKEAIKRELYVQPVSETVAYVIAPSTRPSIYQSVGITGAGSVNLAAAYNDGWNISGEHLFYDKNKGFAFYLNKHPKFASHEATNFMQNAANSFMLMHPECEVIVH